MSTISAQPDLMKLKGASLRRDNAENGGRGFIKIYVDEAGLKVFDRKDGTKGCTLPLILRERDDNYNNNFMVTRSYTEAESEFNKTAPEGAKKQTEILGNGRWLERPANGGASQTDTSGFQEEPAKPAGGGENPDDLPF